MGKQENLTEDNGTVLKKELEKTAKDNPDFRYRFFKQGEEELAPETEQPTHEEILEKLESIERQINLIFKVRHQAR